MSYLPMGTALFAALIVPLGWWVKVPWVHTIVMFFDKEQSATTFNSLFGDFFVLVGTVSVALWIGGFAILALSKYSSPVIGGNLPRMARRLTLSFDVAYGSWLNMAFTNASGCFFLATAISLFMLIPALLGIFFQLALLVAIMLSTGAIIASLQYNLTRFRMLKATLAQLDADLERVNRISRQWKQAKIARSVASPDLSRFDRMTVLLRVGGRTARRIDAGSDSLYKSLYEEGITPIGLSAKAALMIAALLVAFPNPMFASVATLALMVVGLVLILDFARAVVLRIPDALASYDLK